MRWGVSAFSGFLAVIEFHTGAFPVLEGRYWSRPRKDIGIQQRAKQATDSRETSEVRQHWIHGKWQRNNSTDALNNGGFGVSPWHEIRTPEGALEILWWSPKVQVQEFSHQK